MYLFISIKKLITEVIILSLALVDLTDFFYNKQFVTQQKNLVYRKHLILILSQLCD